MDLFYNKVILNLDFNGLKLKNEIAKLINLNKSDVSILNIHFEAKKD